MGNERSSVKSPEVLDSLSSSGRESTHSHRSTSPSSTTSSSQPRLLASEHVCDPMAPSSSRSTSTTNPSHQVTVSTPSPRCTRTSPARTSSSSSHRHKNSTLFFFPSYKQFSSKK